MSAQKIDINVTLAKSIYDQMVEFDSRYSKYSLKTMTKYITNYDSYSEWVWDNKIKRMCPEPFSFYVKVGAFIADEMRGQVLGLYREKTTEGWGDLVVMSKYEWRYMDEDTLHTYKAAVKDALSLTPYKDCWAPEREYYILNLEHMEWIDEPEETLSESMDRWMEALSDDEDLDGIDEDIDEYIIHMLQYKSEMESEILRGK